MEKRGQKENQMTLLGFHLGNRMERIWKIAQVDFKKRYYNDRLGLAWALINPIFRVAIFYLVFAVVLKLREENQIAFMFTGVLVWSFFSETTKRGMKILKQKIYLIESIEFNWLDIYYSFLLSIIMGLAFNLIVLIAVIFLMGIPITLQFLVLPIAFLGLVVFSFGVLLILSTLFPFFEDLSHLWDMLLVLGFWTSGVIFNGEKIAQTITWLPYINPMANIISLFRNGFLGTPFIGWDLIGITLLQVLIFLGIGLRIFRTFTLKALDKI